MAAGRAQLQTRERLGKNVASGFSFPKREKERDREGERERERESARGHWCEGRSSSGARGPNLQSAGSITEMPQCTGECTGVLFQYGAP